MKRIAMACAAWALAAAAGAAALAGVTMPDTVPVAGKTLRLNGQGLRTKVFFKIYVAGLYLENPTHDAARAVSADEAKRVVMHFLYKNVTKKQLVEAWEESFADASLSPDLRRDASLFESWMGDVAAGQEIVLTYEPGKGTMVQFAGQEKGTIPGPDFMRVLWRTWLGPKPPTQDLKKGMMGNS